MFNTCVIIKVNNQGLVYNFASQCVPLSVTVCRLGLVDGEIKGFCCFMRPLCGELVYYLLPADIRKRDACTRYVFLVLLAVISV